MLVLTQPFPACPCLPDGQDRQGAMLDRASEV
jgi:hypothetical protein